VLALATENIALMAKTIKEVISLVTRILSL